MKKIPTLFKRVYENHKIVDVLPEVTEGMEWVLDGEGVATVKYDGACCAIIDGELYKRYDAKKGRKAPKGAIPCCDPDPVTGHHPHWVKCNRRDPADKWFFKAFDEYVANNVWLKDGTFEAVGKHFNGNPYGMDSDILIRHGMDTIRVDRSFDDIKDYLRTHYIEGIVFWKDAEPKCKIKRTDFGYSWGKK